MAHHNSRHGIAVRHDQVQIKLPKAHQRRKHNNQRRNCKVILDTQPSGTYKEPLKDSNGNYVITTGMEAIYVITHETAWNEAGSWSFDINGTIYQYENSDIA